MNLVVSINAALVVFPVPLLLVERVQTDEVCPICGNSDFYVKTRMAHSAGSVAFRVECEHCNEYWLPVFTNTPVSTFRGGTTAREGNGDDIMSKDSKARKGVEKKSKAVDALLASKKEAAGTKPKTQTVKKDATAKVAKPTKTDALLATKLVFVADKARATSGTGKIAAAFGKGRKVSDVVAEQVKTFQRASKGNEGVNDAMIIYFVKEAKKVGALVEA